MNLVRLEQPSRRIVVAIAVPSKTVITEPAAAFPARVAAKKPEREPQPQLRG
jgi:hypothetical protein